MTTPVESASERPALASTRRVRFIAVGVITLATFVYCVLRALPEGLETQFYGLPLNSSVAQLIAVLGPSDAGSYLGAASDLQDGHLSGAYEWVLRLWPPGMPLILAIFIKLAGGGSPILLMVLLISALWATTVAVAAVTILRQRAYLTFAAFVLVWLLSPMFTAWTIHRGILGSDGLATALAALVAMGLLWASQNPSKKPRYALFIVLGIALATLAHLRIMWVYAIPAALGALAVIVMVRALVVAARKRGAPFAKELPSLKQWGALAATFVALCVPWTAYVGTSLHPGDLSWSQGDYQWAQLWMNQDRLESQGGGFLVTGGANWPCEIDPVECQKIEDEEIAGGSLYSGTGLSYTEFRSEAIRVALTRPGPFIVDRSALTVQTWLSTPGSAVASFDNLVFGGASFLAFLASLVILILGSLRGRAGPLLVLLLLGMNLGVLWLTHFETRYVVPLEAISAVVIAFAIAGPEGRLWSRRAALRAGGGAQGVEDHAMEADAQRH